MEKSLEEFLIVVETMVKLTMKTSEPISQFVDFTRLKPLAVLMHCRLSEIDIKAVSRLHVKEGVTFRGRNMSFDQALESLFSGQEQLSNQDFIDHIEAFWSAALGIHRMSQNVEVDLLAALPNHVEMFTCFGNVLGMNKYFSGTDLPNQYDVKFLCIAVILKCQFAASILTRDLCSFSNLQVAIERYQHNLGVPKDPFRFEYNNLEPLLETSKLLTTRPSAANMLEVHLVHDQNDNGLAKGTYTLKIPKRGRQQDIDQVASGKFENEYRVLSRLPDCPNIVRLYGICTHGTLGIFSTPSARSSDVAHCANMTGIMSSVLGCMGRGVTSKSFKGARRHDDASSSAPLPIMAADQFECLVLENFPLGDLETNHNVFFWPALLRVVEDMAYALLVATTSFVPFCVHADIKLANFCLKLNGDAALIDFGDHTPEFTKFEEKSFGYAEMGIPDFDRHSDLYALAMCYLRLLTGEELATTNPILPFERIRTKVETEGGILHVVLGNLRDLRYSEIADQFYELIGRMCDSNREGRPPLFEVVNTIRKWRNDLKNRERLEGQELTGGA